MQVPTTPGHYYAITVTSPCTVSAIAMDGSLTPLLAVSSPGQYGIVAPTPELDVGDSHALVTPARGRSVLPSMEVLRTAILLQTLSQTLAAHAEAAFIHVDQGDRSKWDYKVDRQEFTDHKYSATLHLMSDEHSALTDLIQHKDALLALLNPPQEQPA